MQKADRACDAAVIAQAQAQSEVLRAVPADILEECLALLREGNNVSAIKHLQASAGLSLNTAKQAVETLIGSMFDV
ncbi:hypothetical protein N6L27_19805 [Leisingera sp. SS27]|uniref:hypothetical protein n=1 Tax=Leisingera sp. SS27 TaxID=2979462 RepID=UPI00232BE628|nr:hypothetical protein [Leisingera sp. SS27]MDC0660255.1 hypothetical protein [Leisingera sp. SS27]